MSRLLRSALFPLQLVGARLGRRSAPVVLVALGRLDGANALALGARLADVARTSGTTVICATHDPLLIEQADFELSLGSA